MRIDDALLPPAVEGTDADDRRRVRRLRRLATTIPPSGSVTVLVTHTGNVGAPFDESLLEGESPVFKPSAGAAPMPLGRIKAEDWERASLR